MSVEWIAKNPKPNVINYANQVSMHDSEFSELIKSIIHNRNNYEEKLELLLQAKGFLSAEQAAHVLSAFPRPKDRLKAVMILEPKLVTMTCQEARSILGAISVNEDRLQALQFVKRALSDANTQEGVDNIVATFVYDEHKIIAAKILQTVVSRKGIVLAAGGHQGYSPLGALYTNAPPNNPHIYGVTLNQVRNLPNHCASFLTNDSRVYVSNASDDGFIKQENKTKKEYLDPYKI